MTTRPTTERKESAFSKLYRQGVCRVPITVFADVYFSEHVESGERELTRIMYEKLPEVRQLSPEQREQITEAIEADYLRKLP